MRTTIEMLNNAGVAISGSLYLLIILLSEYIYGNNEALLFVLILWLIVFVDYSAFRIYTE